MKYGLEVGGEVGFSGAGPRSSGWSNSTQILHCGNRKRSWQEAMTVDRGRHRTEKKTKKTKKKRSRQPGSLGQGGQFDIPSLPRAGPWPTGPDD
nr:hypothetical protein CFP56_01334 [Quercus suber]